MDKNNKKKSDTKLHGKRSIKNKLDGGQKLNNSCVLPMQNFIQPTNLIVTPNLNNEPIIPSGLNVVDNIPLFYKKINDVNINNTKKLLNVLENPPDYFEPQFVLYLYKINNINDLTKNLSDNKNRFHQHRLINAFYSLNPNYINDNNKKLAGVIKDFLVKYHKIELSENKIISQLSNVESIDIIGYLVTGGRVD